MRGEWTDKRVELLKKLWAEGETASAIGARLGGLSRSAILGKIFRLRLPGAETASASKPRKNAAADQQRKNTSGQGTGRGADIVRPAASATKNSPKRRRGAGPLHMGKTARGQHKTLLELTNDSCRWPHGRPGTQRFFFCGAAEADLEGGMPYCPRHARRAYLIEPAAAVEAKRTTPRAA